MVKYSSHNKHLDFLKSNFVLWAPLEGWENTCKHFPFYWKVFKMGMERRKARQTASTSNVNNPNDFKVGYICQENLDAKWVNFCCVISYLGDLERA